jgi:hypothetical protein
VDERAAKTLAPTAPMTMPNKTGSKPRIVFLIISFNLRSLLVYPTYLPYPMHPLVAVCPFKTLVNRVHLEIHALQRDHAEQRFIACGKENRLFAFYHFTHIILLGNCLEFVD